jgi:hypothetical protein
MTTRRYQLGRDVRPVSISAEGVWLEGHQRLRPGQEITITHLPAPMGSGERSVRVHSWAVARLGKDGTLYRGMCRWIGGPG